MSIIGSNILAGAAGSGVSAYEIEQSLRFNEAFLSRTPSSAGNRRTFTFSVWLKRMNSGRDGFFGAWSANGNRDAFRFDTSDEFRIFFSETTSGDIFSNALHRDVSAWYHFVVAVDTTQATAADRVKVWINGETASFRSASYPSQNTELFVNNTVGHYIGHTYTQTAQEWQGYLAEFHHIDGTALDHEDFGEFDANGVWRPIAYTGSHGTNGFYLTFDPSATNGIGHDHSGNGNHFTATGFTTSGTGTDVMSDTPTTNYCTINPLDGPTSTTLTYTEGNLTSQSTSSSAVNMVNGTIGVTSGKWYWELTVDSGDRCCVGVALADATRHDYVGKDASGWSIYQLTGNIYHNGTGTSYGSAWTTAGDVLQIALDVDNSKIWFGKNGTYFASGDPAAGTNAAYTNVTGGALFPSIGDGSTTGVYKATYNFGQRAFAYTPPTGFNALNTSNLPAPDIADGSDYFNTVLWTGNGVSGRAITGVGFQPDFLWIKIRNSTASSYLQNSIAGATYYMFSDDTVQERNLDDSVDSFDTDGFTVGNDGGTNGTGGSYVGWSWLAGNGTSSNTDGSITSTVSANPTAGFSIVSYTGNVTSGATIGHGLGVAPSWVIVKNRDSGTQPWRVYHSSLGATKALRLDIDTIQETDTAYWNDTAPSSTVITLGNDNSTNANEDDYIAYCFAEVEGYSKISEFTGNGSTDGSFVYCGFKPSWILLRRYAASRNWYLYDAARDTFNVADHLYYPDLSNVEASTDALDILSNGFKMRTTNTSLNGSGDKILFVAFASSPFGGSGISPATAR